MLGLAVLFAEDHGRRPLAAAPWVKKMMLRSVGWCTQLLLLLLLWQPRQQGKKAAPEVTAGNRAQDAFLW
jgi:hypothetical protein